VANNFGLLEFDGIRWTLYPTPDGSIMRSTFVKNNVIYTGAYMDFGYWLRNDEGTLAYTSLAETVGFQTIEDEQFWNIFSHKQYILFQSLSRLVIYNQQSNTLETYNSEHGILFAFANDDEIYFQDNNRTLFKIENEKSSLHLSATELNQNQVVGIVNSSVGQLIVTRENGLFINGRALKPIQRNLSKNLAKDVVYSFTQAANGQLILGTVKNGVYILSESGALVHHINVDNGLNNDTVLSVFSENRGVWLGLDDGLAFVKLDSAIQQYNFRQEAIGTVYTTIVFNQYLYVGTNQGLFYRRYDVDEPLKPIAGLEGQVWTLEPIKNKLFCGHDRGAFLVNENRAKQLYAKSGMWTFKQISDELLIAGAYDGLHVFSNKSNTWAYQNHLKDFSISSRYFEMLDDTHLLVSHEYKGIYKLTIDEAKTAIVEVEQIPNVPKSTFSSLRFFEDDIYYFSKDGFYTYDNTSNSLVKNDAISQLFNEDNFTTAKMVVDKSEYLWLFGRNNIYQLKKAALANDLLVRKFPIAYDTRKTITGFENLSRVENDIYHLGTSRGFFRLDISKIKSVTPEIGLSTLVANNKKGDSQFLNLTEEASLDYDFNTITASLYFTNNTILDLPRFQYKLEGYSDSWSPWTEDATVTFSNLKFGTYNLSVRAMLNDVVSEKTFNIPFNINRPYYFSNIALLVYFIFMIGIFLAINNRYTHYYRREQEKLIKENKRKIDMMQFKQNEEIMRIKNEQLEDNIDKKNKELAISTMAFIKKNQFMNSLLIDLEPAATDPTVSRVLRTIKRSLKNDDDWEFFEQAFDNADKDFLKRLKQQHEALTNHDLKLCAYLRLNLSSKEIAPLLSISVKSVDIKRYRLRKKMDLEHNQNLTEYILSL
jgi:ligand-binding sensor domain-containing protein/DNA-binding CsgD family transcriptional regulator